jgi:hypothetical protein
MMALAAAGIRQTGPAVEGGGAVSEVDRRPPVILAGAADLIAGWITVTTASMVPLLRPGDGVEVRPAVPRLGDVILVGHDDHLLLHRVLRLDERVLWLGGDATASWEGPFPLQVWPVAVTRRREGRETPLTRLPAHAFARRLLPAVAARPLLRRLWARLLREWHGDRHP